MSSARRYRIGLIIAALGLALVQITIAHLVLEDRFSFINLVDVKTPEEFDDPAWVIGNSTVFDLSFPTTGPEFEQLVARELASVPESDAGKFAAAVVWAHAHLTPDSGPSRDTVFTPRDGWAAGDVVEESRRGEKVWCDTYARLTASVAHTLGVDARVIWLAGHVTAEGFDRQHQRWIGADPTISALLSHPEEATPLSFAEAAILARSGSPVEVRLLGPVHPEIDVEGSVQYLNKVLRRDLLVYVDGETTVMGNTVGTLIDWMAGQVHGVRMVSEASGGRLWKRWLLTINSLVFLLLIMVFIRSARKNVGAGRRAEGDLGQS